MKSECNATTMIIMKTVLIIEDNEDVRENTAAILELSGYTVVTAENGKIGVEVAKKTLPDIIVCDIMMPVLDGYGVLEALNENTVTAAIPFIFLTAMTEKVEMRKGMNLGADDYLTKPFSEKELLEAIESRLKRTNFFKKEFPRTVEGVTDFIDHAATFLDLAHLSNNYERTNFRKKEIVFLEGSATSSLYFIESGVVKTFKTAENGKELVTGFHSAGHFLGQLSLLSDAGVYTESAIVIEDAQIYKMPKLDFASLINGNKEVANKFVHLISNNMVEIQEQLINIAFATVRQRLAKALLEIANTGILVDETSEGIAITREDLAGIIGTATETAIRMLTEFKEEGIITFDASRKIYIKNQKLLEDIVLFG